MQLNDEEFSNENILKIKHVLSIITLPTQYHILSETCLICSLVI